MSRFLITAALVLVGCGGGGGTTGKAVDSCGLDITNLAGKSFLMYEAMPDKTWAAFLKLHMDVCKGKDTPMWKTRAAFLKEALA